MSDTAPQKNNNIAPNVKKASDLFVRALETEGVEYIFALPGEENLDIVETTKLNKGERV